MSLLSSIWWPSALLAAVLLFDALASLWPPRFIRDCLNGVQFPREWWWALIVIKMLAVVGLIVGIWVPGVAVAANTGVIVYFICAAAAHLRTKFIGLSFWVNCLGMLMLSVGVLVLNLLFAQQI